MLFERPTGLSAPCAARATALDAPSPGAPGSPCRRVGAVTVASAAAQSTAAPPPAADEPGIAWRDRPTIDLGNGSRIELRARIQSQFLLRDDSAEADELPTQRGTVLVPAPPRRHRGRTVRTRGVSGRTRHGRRRRVARPLRGTSASPASCACASGSSRRRSAANSCGASSTWTYVARSTAVDRPRAAARGGRDGARCGGQPRAEVPDGVFERKGYGRFWSAEPSAPGPAASRWRRCPTAAGGDRIGWRCRPPGAGARLPRVAPGPRARS